MNNLLLLFDIAVPLLFAFILLYPFHLRDNKPQHYKGIWLLLGTFIKNRYGAVWMLNVGLGIDIGNKIRSCTQNYLLGIIATSIWILFFGGIFLWYPFHLKHKRPEKYQGIWKTIGEWLGEWGAPSPPKK